MKHPVQFRQRRQLHVPVFVRSFQSRGAGMMWVPWAPRTAGSDFTLRPGIVDLRLISQRAFATDIAQHDLASY